MGEQARQYAQQYDWKIIVGRMIDEVYTPLLGSPLHPFVPPPAQIIGCAL